MIFREYFCTRNLKPLTKTVLNYKIQIQFNKKVFGKHFYKTTDREILYSPFTVLAENGEFFMEERTEKQSVFKQLLTTRALARAGIIAALYAALTWVFGDLAYGPLQIRPAEALCILPLFFVEAVPGLFVGCALANLLSGYGIYDIAFGSLTTLLAASITFIIGVLLKRNLLSAILGGIPPVLFNAIVIPFVIILGDVDTPMAAYRTMFGEFMLTQSVWVYALGLPLYFAIKRLREKSVKALT